MEQNMIQIIDIDSPAEWDAIVCSFKDYDVYSLSGYVKAFQIHGDGLPVLVYYEADGLRAYNVVMKRDIADDPNFSGKLGYGIWYDLATPYGYGGWLVEGTGDISILDNVYTKFCAQQGIVSEFVRYHPMWNNALQMGQMYDVIPLGPTIAMDLKDQQTIWNNISSKNRNMIRKAQKNGVEVRYGQEADDYAIFRKMYNATMDKDDAEEYYYFKDTFYNSIRTDMEKNAQVFTAYHKEKPIAAAIILYANGKVNYHLSGSDKEYRTLAPTNLILYEAAVWGSEHGFFSFHLGGGLGSHEDNLYRFKQSFYKGEPKQFAIGRKIFLPDIYIYLNDLRMDAPANSFFPEYRRPATQSKE